MVRKNIVFLFYLKKKKFRLLKSILERIKLVYFPFPFVKLEKLRIIAYAWCLEIGCVFPRDDYFGMLRIKKFEYLLRF